jgi:hypothetical protein
MDRTAPRRDFSTLLGQTDSPASPDEQGHAARPTQATGNPIVDGVQAAYQVIDSYLREGQRAAQQYRSVVTPPRSPEASGNADLQARSLQVWTDLMANWFDLLGVFTSTMQSARSDVKSVQLAYEVASAQPARVDAQFHEGRQTPYLVSHGLRSLTSDSCIDVTFDLPQDDGPVVVKIRVPDQQAPGVYTGPLLHARDGSIVGSMTLQL